MTVRQARSGDAAAIARVHVDSWRVAYRGQLPQPYLDGLDVRRRADTWRRIVAAGGWPRSGALVVEEAGTVVGFAHVCPTRDEDGDPATVGEVSAIYVIPRRWGTGVGHRLMTASLSALAGAGFRTATLWVLDGNARARRFYAAAGWRPDGACRDELIADRTVTEVRYARSLDDVPVSAATGGRPVRSG